MRHTRQQGSRRVIHTRTRPARATRTRVHTRRTTRDPHAPNRQRHVSARATSALLPASCHAAFRARKLWKYITGDAQPPHFSETDDDDDDDTLHIQYQTQLENWDSVNSRLSPGFQTHQSHLSIRFLLLSRLPRKYGDYLAERYSSVDGANEYQLGLELHHLRFDSDRSRLRHFLMALPPDYEHIRASLLHCHPLPTVGQALVELRSEETRKKTMVYQHSQPVLATPVCAPLQPPSQRDTHSYEDCRSCLKPKRKGYHNRQTAAVTNSSGPSPDSPSSTLTAVDVETIVIQVLSRTNLHSSALSTTSDISKTPPPSGLGRPLFTDPSLDTILPVTSPSSAGSPPSPSLPSHIMAVPDVSPPAAPPSVPCPPVRSSTRFLWRCIAGIIKGFRGGAETREPRRNAMVGWERERERENLGSVKI
ncbi:hypothetical protein Acr_00g0085840 [Actinidia rufa]|uniref:Uncharacterized protein n=1 Tax=Actinidia rufa TaxID=165716 RepID=A0A7J0DXE3_9ERIC|nr:hypothetical protein Acr_00g0085840 [Actinidia rufa]